MPLSPALRRLARLHGVQTAYRDQEGRWREAGEDALLAVLAELDAPLADPGEVDAAARRSRLARWRRRLEPVLVAGPATQGEGRRMATLRVPYAERGLDLELRLEREDGEASEWSARPSTLERTVREVAGERFLRCALPLPGHIPPGHHRLLLRAGGAEERAHLLVPPASAHRGPARPEWGLFAPTHALRSRGSVGVGDVGDLERLAGFVGARGGGFLATLPLCAAFLDEPFEPSPYAPVSRLFWNELHLDLRSAPGLESCAEARVVLESGDFRERAAALEQGGLVDHRAAAALRREALDPLAACVLGDRDPPADFRTFLRERPEAEAYADFRAKLTAGRGGDPRAERRYHLYAQWAMERRLARLSQGARRRGCRLYFDLPLGVHRDGYDVAGRPALWARDASAGAPPDPFFTGGQDWGFPPLRPDRSREDGHAYFRAVLDAQLRHAGMLRVDHVMGLHRLYWIPAGFPATEGVYVRYPARELHAVLALASRRHRAEIVGEDLGTVPGAVREAMRRHGIRRMWVAGFEAHAEREGGLSPVPAGSVASPNTHDMPPWAAFWTGADIDLRVRVGHLDEEEAARERIGRARLRTAMAAGLGGLRGEPEEAGAALRALLARLGAGPAARVLVALEDLWGETEPQNVPGTWREYPNWRRRMRHALEGLEGLEEVRGALAGLAGARAGREESETRIQEGGVDGCGGE